MLPAHSPTLSEIRGPSVVLGRTDDSKGGMMDVDEVPIVDLALSQLATYVEGVDAAKKLRHYFRTQEFRTICSKVWHEVDKDCSGSIDSGELLAAYKLVMQRIPSKSAVLNVHGMATQSKLLKLGKNFVGRVWQYLDVDKNGWLCEKEFVTAMMVLWTEGVKVNSKATGPNKILKRVFTGLYQKFPKEAVDNLRKKFETKDFMDTCERVFRKVDADGNNKLDRRETYNAFRQVLQLMPEINKAMGYRTLEYTDRTAKLLLYNTFHHLDTDSSGYLEWNEFPKAMELLWCEAFRVAKRDQARPSTPSSSSSSSSSSGSGLTLDDLGPPPGPPPLTNSSPLKRRKNNAPGDDDAWELPEI